MVNEKLAKCAKKIRHKNEEKKTSEKRLEQKQRDKGMAMHTRVGNMTWEETIKGTYGKMSKKIGVTKRVMFMIPFNNMASRNREIRSQVKQYKVNILGLAETNVNWKVIPFMH